MKIRFKNIIFDFDGTLIDSRPGVVSSFQKVGRKLFKKEIREKEIVRLIGKPLAEIISILFKINDKFLVEKASLLFKEFYSREGIKENILYLGIKDMLESFKKNSLSLFVISNKIEPFIKNILKQHNIDKYFKDVIGTDGMDRKSKKADYIKRIVNVYNLKKTKTVVAGDTENDIISAKRNGIYAVGVVWGYGSKESLIKAGADKICSSPFEFKKFILNKI